MRCGDILGLFTKQAPNHPQGKYKYHLYLCLESGYQGKHLLLLVNSNDWGGGMRIDRGDWPQMPKHRSFIHIRPAHKHDKNALAEAKPRGRLSDDALARLMDHVAQTRTLEEWDADLIIDAIRAYFGD